MLFPDKMGHPSKVTVNPDHTLTLSNGIVSRRFITQPNFATIDVRHEIEDYTYFRCVSAESLIRFSDPFSPGTVQTAAIGGLLGQNFGGLFSFHYFNLTSDPTAFQFLKYAVVPIQARYFWKPQRYSYNVAWPPKGIQLEVYFTPPANSIPVVKNLIVKVVYQVIDASPILVKWVEVLNEDTLLTVKLNEVVVETVRIREFTKARMDVMTDYMPRHDYTSQVLWEFMGPGQPYGDFDVTTVFYLDPQYEMNTDNDDQNLRGDMGQVRLLLNVTYPVGPGYWVEPRQSFTSFRTYLFLYDTEELQRQTLQGLMIYPLLAPQTTENFMVFYATDCSTYDTVILLIDQASNAGFEAIVCAPYSGFDPVNQNLTFIGQWKQLADYAHRHDIKIGGYVCLQGLFSDNSRIVLPGSGPYGVACFATDTWSQNTDAITQFVALTGVDLLETDCPYEGSWCNSTEHNHHGLADSQIMQFQAQVSFYQTLKNQFNLIIRAPDPYYMSAGVNQAPLGYTDAQWTVQNRNLRESEDYSRMYIFDGLHHKVPTMGWVGGAASDLSPWFPMNNSVNLHGLDYAYAMMLGNGLASSCPQYYLVYDSIDGLKITQKWTTFYRQHRRILTQPVIQLRRPDGRSWDCIMHVDSDPKADERAIGVVFNNTPYPVNVTVPIPLYYANFSVGTSVMVTQSNAHPSGHEYVLDDIYTVYMPLYLERHSYMHFIVTALNTQ